MSAPNTLPKRGLHWTGGRNDLVLLGVIIALSIAIGISNPTFFSASTAFDLARSSFVIIIFALGLLMVIISGGIDVSFPVIGIFAGYTTVRIMQEFELDERSLIIPVVIAIIIGGLLGSFNSLVIAGFGLPTLIATLATLTIFRGALLTFVGSTYVSNIPSGLDDFATYDLFTTTGANDTIARLHILIIPVVLLCFAIGFLLRHTMFGRTLYAIGGNEEAARRIGMKTRWTKARLYVLTGMMGGLAGIIYVALQRKVDPYDLAGLELEVIAAVVLGGASIMGGYGTVTGTVLGVLVINMIKNNLILLGVPSSWQRFAIGALLIIGVVSQAISARSAKKRASVLSGGDQP
jgi:simple sugar transport system permease protein